MCLNRCPHCGTVEVPSLQIDDFLKRNFGRDRNPTTIIEQRIVANLLVHLSEHGFKALLIDDTEEETAILMPSQLMNLMFNLDDCRVYFYVDDPEVAHFIRFVFGNGFACISDWSFAVDDATGFNEVMNLFVPERFA